MNFYYYWFYTIYDIYTKIFKYDYHFDLAATGMFTFIILTLMNFIFEIIQIIFKINIKMSIYPYIICGLSLYFINIFLFSRNNQAKQYSNYKKHFIKWKSIFFLILSVLVFILYGIFIVYS